MQPKGMNFSIYTYKDPADNIFVAHCLELDLVSTGDTEKEALEGLLGIVKAHITYAFENDNLVNMYSSAPSEIWEKYYKCGIYSRILNVKVKRVAKKAGFVPPVFSTNICNEAVECR